MKIIDELLELLSNTSITLTEIFFKAKILANELKNEEFKSWVNNELNGYNENEIPHYRRFPCEIRATVSNGYVRKNLLLPLSYLDDDIKKQVQTLEIRQSISTLYQFMEDRSDRRVIIRLPDGMYAYMSKEINDSFYVESIVQAIYKSQIEEALTKVRVKFLDFLFEINGESDNSENLKLGVEKLTNDFVDGMNALVIGDNATIFIGNHNAQNISNNTNNIEELEKFLTLHKVNVELIDDLKNAINLDKGDANHTNRKFGKNVIEWSSKMFNKSLEGTWQVAIGTAGNIISDALKLYYGWK